MNTPPRRLPGWETRLHDLVDGARRRPYRLGEWDCAIFAAEAVEALTGECPKALRGMYRSKREAVRRIREHGGTLAKAVSATLGCEPIAAAQAQRGDVLLRREAGAEHLGVCIGAAVATLNQAGLQFRERADFLMAWPVGRLP